VRSHQLAFIYGHETGGVTGRVSAVAPYGGPLGPVAVREDHNHMASSACL
jgi:hypothetical protein